ncbi:hypothetical protein SLS56_005677 [Neofusicoccum ribis]|uniref:Uncharacterized protein n=1 Tax=Neofusicoccum ribis TaxID=45134 RepID=A0ABR3STS1_9PEZI
MIYQTQEDSLIVRLIMDKDTEEEHGISLRGLVNRVDAIEAAVWFAKPKMRSIQGFNDANTLLKYRLSRKECLKEQYSVDSTLAAMQSSDDESRGPIHISTGIPKVDFSSLKPIIRYTIIANMYTAALQEGFRDPFFPIQRLIDVSAKQILHALSMIEKTYFDGFYPDSITSQAMVDHVLHARRFLVQQGWPRRFLKPVNVPRYEMDPDVEIQAPHAPLGTTGLPATHLDFFGRLAELNCKELNEVFFGAQDGVARDARNEALNRIWTPRRVRRTLSGLRGSPEQQLPRSRLRLGQMAFTAGAAQAELQRVRREDRGEERAEQEPATPPRQVQQTYGARAMLERHHTPDFVNSPPILPTGNYSAFGVHTRENNAPNCSPSRPRFRFKRHSSPQQMAQPARITPPSKQPDPPSVVYGQQSSLEESEFAVLTMMGATSSRAVGSNDASPPKKKQKDTPKAAARPDQQQPQPLATRSPNLLPAPPLPPAPKPSPATTTTQHDAHHHVFETAYHRQIQEQQAAQALSSLHRSASTAATRPAGFHAHPSSSSSSSSSSPDAVPPAPPSTPASGAPHPSVSGRGMAVAPPRVVPTAPMTTERTVRAHFAFPDRSNVRLPPSLGVEGRAGSVAVESAGPSAGGGRMDPFEVFMAGVVEQARGGGGDGGSGGRGGDGGVVE